MQYTAGGDLPAVKAHRHPLGQPLAFIALELALDGVEPVLRYPFLELLLVLGPLARVEEPRLPAGVGVAVAEPAGLIAGALRPCRRQTV